MRKDIDYAPVDTPESNGLSISDGDVTVIDNNIDEARDGLMIGAETSSFEPERGIDYAAVNGLVGDIRELRKGLLVLLLLFIIFGGLIALDDYYAYHNMEFIDGMEQIALDQDGPPHPHRGHKLQINESAFTVNDFECLQLDTGNWPSERVHCELTSGSSDSEDIAEYDFVVEHFDDNACQRPNADNPIVKHTASGCFYFEAYNHSYHDLCHANRTLTISAFYGPGCLTPMPVTAVNILPEDEG